MKRRRGKGEEERNTFEYKGVKMAQLPMHKCKKGGKGKGNRIQGKDADFEIEKSNEKRANKQRVSV